MIQVSDLVYQAWRLGIYCKARVDEYDDLRDSAVRTAKCFTRSERTYAM